MFTLEHPPFFRFSGHHFALLAQHGGRPFLAQRHSPPLRHMRFSSTIFACWHMSSTSETIATCPSSGSTTKTLLSHMISLLVVSQRHCAAVEKQKTASSGDVVCVNTIFLFFPSFSFHNQTTFAMRRPLQYMQCVLIGICSYNYINKMYPLVNNHNLFHKFYSLQYFEIL